jgi:hypothetical protein
MAATLLALFLARWLAIQASRWAWRGIAARGRDVILWILPRGLITVVLSIAVAKERGPDMAFLPGLAFAVILATNLMVIWGSLRAPRVALAEAAASSSGGAATEIASATPSTHEPAPPSPSIEGKRPGWILDFVLLVFLALSALFLWYGDQSPESRPAGIERWVSAHLKRSL